MHQDPNRTLTAHLSAEQQDTSDYAEANTRIGERPSYRLNDTEWRSIADSLHLSARQLQIVRCLFDGLNEPTIGHALGVSSHTVHAHLNRLYKKIGVKSRCQLIVHVFVAYLDRTSASSERASELVS